MAGGFAFVEKNKLQLFRPAGPYSSTCVKVEPTGPGDGNSKLVMQGPSILACRIAIGLRLPFQFRC